MFILQNKYCKTTLMINFTRNGKRNTRLFYKENIWLKDKVNRTCLYFNFWIQLTVFGKETKRFAWVWKIMILSRCLDAKWKPFVVMRDQLSRGWQDIVVDNKFHCFKKINFLKVPFDNALTAYFIKLRNDIFKHRNITTRSSVPYSIEHI
jgi:hypothetical protein